jgi:hypothetical protein
MGGHGKVEQRVGKEAQGVQTFGHWTLKLSATLEMAHSCGSTGFGSEIDHSGPTSFIVKGKEVSPEGESNSPKATQQARIKSL